MKINNYAIYILVLLFIFILFFIISKYNLKLYEGLDISGNNSDAYNSKLSSIYNLNRSSKYDVSYNSNV